MEEKIKQIGISGGRRLTIQESDKPSVSSGKHLVVEILARDDAILGHDDLSETDKGEAFLLLMQYLQKQHPDGIWTIILNGPGLGEHRPTFHLHGILPRGQGQILKLSFNPSAFLKRLKKYVSGQEGLRRHPSDIAELDSLVKEFEDNLK
jgi:hypothetical protein